MEITLETKIKDLLSKGIELSNSSWGDGSINIFYKKKQPKTFEEYEKSCLNNEWDPDMKMDLLQYICQDLGISNERMFVFIYKYIMEQPLTDEFATLRDILPNNFINELIK